MREITFWQAINEALREEMERDPAVFLIGEDIGVYGGAYGATRGLIERFGPERVRDTPISENSIVGVAVGAAMTNMRPVAEIMYVDFLGLAMDQIANQAAKIRYMFGGKASVPMVLRTEGGAGRTLGAHHSQSLEAWLLHVPGIKVVMPATPYDAKGLLKSAIRDDNPVVFIEHKMLYRVKGPVPSGDYAIPFGQAVIRRSGRHVTVVALAAMVHKAMVASEKLATQGIDIEVIDPRTLVPFDLETVAESVKKTGRLVVFQESSLCCGFGSEIARVVGEAAFDYLEAPIKVIGTTVPLPSSPVLEAAALPSEQTLIDAVCEVLEGCSRR